MSKATEMISQLETFLAKNVGVESVTVDGQTVRFERDQAMKELEYWRGMAAKESGKRKLFKPISLS